MRILRWLLYWRPVARRGLRRQPRPRPPNRGAPTCSGTVDAETRSAGCTSTTRRTPSISSVPDRLSRPAGADRVPDPDPRRLRQRRRDAGFANNLPYELDAKGTGYRYRAADRRHPQRGVRPSTQNVGGVRPQTFYKAFNWDVAKNAPITFDTLFKPGTKPLDVIFPIVQPSPRQRRERSIPRYRRGRRSRPGEVPELRADRRLD